MIKPFNRFLAQKRGVFDQWRKGENALLQPNPQMKSGPSSVIPILQCFFPGYPQSDPHVTNTNSSFKHGAFHSMFFSSPTSPLPLPFYGISF